MPSKKRKKKTPLHKRVYSQLGGLKLQGKVKATKTSVLIAALVVVAMGAGVYKLSSHASGYAQIQLNVKGLPSGVKVAMSSTKKVGSCGTSFSVGSANKYCTSVYNIPTRTVYYPTHYRWNGITYTAYEACGGFTDGTHGAGGCDPNPTGSATVSDTVGGSWSFLEVDYKGQ
jgi:hypothetical protein